MPSPLCPSVLAAAALLSGSASAFAAQSNVAASSVAEFSLAQGQSGWHYGYYDRTGDKASPGYAAADFQPFSASTASSGRWHLAEGAGGFWTMMKADRAHANSTSTTDGRLAREHWAVRRWISDEEGTFTISGQLALCSTLAVSRGGDGVIGEIYIDGVKAYARSLNAGDLTGVNFSLAADLDAGSTVDFVLLPKGNDRYDTTIFTAVVQGAAAVPEPAAALSMFAACVLMARRHSRRR